MRLQFIIVSSLLLVLNGCAAFTELKPKPDIIPTEGTYIELKNDKKYFELKKDKKYFIKFPQVREDHFYLVLNIPNKALINSYLTQKFDDGKGAIIKINDETHIIDSISVFPVDSASMNFFWVIDSVRQNHLLRLDYRYVPVWRYKWEVKHVELENGLKQNRVDRNLYNTLGTEFTFEGFDFDKAVAEIQTKTQAINKVNEELESIKKTFPEDIVSYNDIAYQNYKQLVVGIAEELQFQSDYLLTIQTFQTEFKTRQDSAAFVKIVPALLDYMNQKERWPLNVLTEAKKTFGARLRGVFYYYDGFLKNKNDVKPITFDIDNIESLHKASADSVSNDFSALASFVRQYNIHAEKYVPFTPAMTALKNKVASLKSWPDSNFYPVVLTELSVIKNRIPKVDINAFGNYKSYRCVGLLTREAQESQKSVSALESQYQRANGLVPEINSMKNKLGYQSIIRLLKKNSDLDFFVAHYADVDQLSLNQQKISISSALKDSQWTEAELHLRGLYTDQEFLNLNAITAVKNQTVKTLEEEFFTGVENISKQTATQFVEANKLTTDTVENLYKSAAFKPAHDITFYTGSEKEFNKRKKIMIDRLDVMKNETFPATAIEALYKDFTSNINNNGVAKARAVAMHGKYYKGNDKKIINIVAECDTRIAKWITKPTQYRKFYVLPITSNKNGVNEYLFRLNVQIESEAQFPVFDINIKLPEEVAQSSGLSQWYDEITINKKAIKNEGRFLITAPTAGNSYECQITPVQMAKGGDNILEVRFKHNSFKVFEISVMAQKPIIKKN
ncbi:hypothetical protein JNL27_14215 [bacterium]|nr:hypothetical protein [bacterium]